ncbi:bifunctional adenosylcobinamide kinase/adenosylcobinamide-phosphate guanylyltransferase [Mycobacterium sp. C31M]
MRTLILGGIRSGKSQYAEALLADAPAVRYLATGPVPEGQDSWTARVDAHRSRRASHWATVESADAATQLRTDRVTATLVDDIGGWLTAAMDRRGAWAGAPVGPDADELCAAVGEYTGPLVLVSPEVGLTVVSATPAGRLFTDELGTLNQRLAALCDRVVLVIAGQPLVVKECQ